MVLLSDRKSVDLTDVLRVRLRQWVTVWNELLMKPLLLTELAKREVGRIRVLGRS